MKKVRSFFLMIEIFFLDIFSTTFFGNCQIAAGFKWVFYGGSEGLNTNKKENANKKKETQIKKKTQIKKRKCK